MIDPIVDWLAESPSNSFVAGTGVVTGEDENGNLITTNIEDLEIGDLVLARDEFDPNAPNRYSIVTAVSHRTVYEQTTVTYIDESGNTEVIESTGNHEYYINGLGWVTAELLTAGQEVVLPDGRAATITSVVSTEIPEGVEVYNLTVADGATYFVDDGNGEVSAAWVHNVGIANNFVNLVSKASTNKLIGDVGENATIQFLRSRGYRNIVQIQNASNHGIDIVAMNARGKLRFFEVKSHRLVAKAKLSKSQQDIKEFVNLRLQRATSNRGRWVVGRGISQQDFNAANAIVAAIEGGQKIKGIVVNVDNVIEATLELTFKIWS